MRACLFSALVVLSAMNVACGSSHSTDGGITFDAMVPDAGTDGGRDARVPVCGDGMLGPMEQCDDGNTTSGDGCDASCHRESFCGDDRLDMGEICDDGNNRSGDGCRADCLSDETCGNRIRDVVVGERCDDGNTVDGDGCSGDCLIIETCGDGTVDASTGETCDDGNTTPFDGCGPDCRDEVAMVINSLAIGGPDVGCDYSGDGRPDNSLARAFGIGVELLNMQLSMAVRDGSLLLLMQFLGLDDPAGVNDDAVTVAWLQGEDADMDPTNNFSGSGELLASADAYDAMGNPLTSFSSSIRTRMLAGGPEDVSIPVSFVPIELRGGRIHATTTASAGSMTGLDEGLLCGAAPISIFALLPNFLDMVGTPAPPCDGSMDSGSMADVLVGGATVFGIPIGGTQPDVDLDGDGLEYFEVNDSGPAGCQAVISACVDGDGRRVEGRGCAADPSFADGYSTGLPFTAVRANIVGLTGMVP